MKLNKKSTHNIIVKDLIRKTTAQFSIISTETAKKIRDELRKLFE